MNTEFDHAEEMAIVAVNRHGAELGRRLKLRWATCHLYVPQKYVGSANSDEVAFSPPAREVVEGVFHRYRKMVLIMAVGIAVRLVGHQARDKRHDPAVVVVDDAGKFAVSLLSGHEGGANELAQEVASCLGAAPVVTTASEVHGTISATLLGRELGWEIESKDRLTAVSAALVNGDLVGVYQDAGETDWTNRLPDNVCLFAGLDALRRAKPAAALVITDRIFSKHELDMLPRNTLIYRPRSLVVGIGCNRGTPASRIEDAVTGALSAHGLSVKSVKKLATIDLKKDETGLAEFAGKNGLAIDYFDNDTLGKVKSPSPPSATVARHVGTPSVCEAAAITSSGSTTLVVPKETFHRAVTVAVARLSRDEPEKEGKLALVGIGPGSLEQMTIRAREAIEESDVVVGYHTYLRLIPSLLHKKETVDTGMGAEVERARMAISLAKQGKKVAFISSGDSGIYGMAGLVGEILGEHPDDTLTVEVVPGVTSLVSAAALLGAPISLDFAAISLSDYLVSWGDITKRLALAAEGNFVIALYNPKSRKRQQQLVEARDIVLRYRLPSTPVGLVTNAYRQEQQVVITDLAHMLDHEIGMDTTVIIGNSTTSVINHRMVTPRGYGQKYDLG